LLERIACSMSFLPVISFQVLGPSGTDTIVVLPIDIIYLVGILFFWRFVFAVLVPSAPLLFLLYLFDRLPQEPLLDFLGLFV
jgi:hypothetical protein